MRVQRCQLAGQLVAVVEPHAMVLHLQILPKHHMKCNSSTYLVPWCTALLQLAVVEPHAEVLDLQTRPKRQMRCNSSTFPSALVHSNAAASCSRCGGTRAVSQALHDKGATALQLAVV
jgi:hypothetical protein